MVQPVALAEITFLCALLQWSLDCQEEFRVQFFFLVFLGFRDLRFRGQGFLGFRWVSYYTGQKTCGRVHQIDLKD